MTSSLSHNIVASLSQFVSQDSLKKLSVTNLEAHTWRTIETEEDAQQLTHEELIEIRNYLATQIEKSSGQEAEDLTNILKEIDQYLNIPLDLIETVQNTDLEVLLEAFPEFSLQDQLSLLRYYYGKNNMDMIAALIEVTGENAIDLIIEEAA